MVAGPQGELTAATQAPRSEMSMTAISTRRQLHDTRHGQLQVRSTGDGGVPLVLLHSMIIAGRWFDHATPQLAQDRTVIVPDRIGQGGSDPQRSQLTIPDFVDAYVDALDAMGIEQFDLAGIHTGGIEAVELATSRPERVRRLVTIPASVFSAEEAAAGKELFGPPPAPAPDGSHLRFYWDLLMSIQAEGVGLDEVQGWLVDFLIAAPNYWWMFAGAVDYPMAERLPRVSQPMLVIAPGDDTIVQSRRARQYLPPQAEQVDLPEATVVTSVFSTHVDTVVGLMRAFLA